MRAGRPGVDADLNQIFTWVEIKIHSCQASCCFKLLCSLWPNHLSFWLFRKLSNQNLCVSLNKTRVLEPSMSWRLLAEKSVSRFEPNQFNLMFVNQKFRILDIVMIWNRGWLVTHHYTMALIFELIPVVLILVSYNQFDVFFSSFDWTWDGFFKRNQSQCIEHDNGLVDKSIKVALADIAVLNKSPASRFIKRLALLIN